MKLKVHHPRILIVLLLMIGALSSTAIILAQQEEELPTRVLPLPTAPTPPPLSEQDREDAVAIVKRSGVVESINQGQDWEPENIYRAKIKGTEGILLEPKWSRPVESSGPWSVLHCSGTIKAFTTESWSQVTRLVVWVDMEHRSVAGFGVTSEPEDEPRPILDPPDAGESLKLYDQETGEILYEGAGHAAPNESEICEEGTYYLD